MKKVIFTDVDGVLVHSGSIGNGRLSGETFSSSFYHAATVCPLAMAQYKRILDATGAYIVLSSVWRRFPMQFSGLQRALMNAGMPRRDIRERTLDSTPYLGREHVLPNGNDDRAAEIQRWLETHDPVDRYLVLDDGVVGTFPQLDPQPDWHHGGLLEAHADQAIAILNATEHA